MKLSSAIVLGTAMVTSSLVAAGAQALGPASIAFINGDRVLEGSSIGRGARERLEAEAARWQERIAGVQAELDTMTRNRRDQAMTLNAAALDRLNRDIEEREVQLQRLNDDARRELVRLEQQMTLEVNAQLGPQVERFATDNGFDLIFDGARMQGILFFASSRDVTDDFLASVNAGASGGPQQ